MLRKLLRTKKIDFSEQNTKYKLKMTTTTDFSNINVFITDFINNIGQNYDSEISKTLLEAWASAANQEEFETVFTE